MRRKIYVSVFSVHYRESSCSKLNIWPRSNTRMTSNEFIAFRRALDRIYLNLFREEIIIQFFSDRDYKLNHCFIQANISTKY